MSCLRSGYPAQGSRPHPLARKLRIPPGSIH
nr:MAG TPA: hypothetical protein [Caudoviricetes sp.]